MIGHHQLEGKFATLPKPLAILKKQVVKEQADTDMLLDDTFVQKSAPEWDMVAIVKRKIVFAKRPMPIVNSKPVSSVVSSAS
jgi:chromosome transmission fidelity protein 8